MARTHGWAPRGERLPMAVPHGHWNTTTFVAGFTCRGMIAPFVLTGAIDGDAFEANLKRGPRPRTAARRCRRNGQPLKPQGTQSPKNDRRRRRAAPFPALLQPRLQPHRTCLRKAQGKAPKCRRENCRRPVEYNRPNLSNLLPTRMSNAISPADCLSYARLMVISCWSGGCVVAVQPRYEVPPWQGRDARLQAGADRVVLGRLSDGHALQRDLALLQRCNSRSSSAWAPARPHSCSPPSCAGSWSHRSACRWRAWSRWTKA